MTSGPPPRAAPDGWLERGHFHDRRVIISPATPRLRSEPIALAG